MENIKIMKLLLAFLLIFPLYGNIPFKIGEELNYDASFGSIDAAKGSLKVLNKESINNIMTYHVQFTAKSKGIINYLFPINDQIDIWLNEQSLLPIKVISNIREGKYKEKSETYINHEAGYAITNGDTLEIGNEIHSPYSLFYFFRGQEIVKMEGQTIETIQGKKIMPLEIKIEENINETVPAGTYYCSKVSPSIKGKKQFKNKATMSILFSNDDNRYPIKIWMSLKYGNLTLSLNEIIN